MSIDVRYLTNGKKTAYVVLHTDTGDVEVFEKREDIPKSVEHFFRKMNKPKMIEPDFARILGVKDVFYPDWDKICTHPEFNGEKCIAESCGVYSNECWKKCGYMKDKV